MSTTVIDVVLSDSGGVYVCSKGNAKQEQKEMRDDGLLKLMMIVKQKRRGKKKRWADKYTCMQKPRNPKKRGRLGGANKRGVAGVLLE